MKAADEVLKALREELLWFFDILKRWEIHEYMSPLLAMTTP